MHGWDESLSTTPQNIWAVLLVVYRLLLSNHLIPTVKFLLFLSSRWDFVCLCIHWVVQNTTTSWTMPVVFALSLSLCVLFLFFSSLRLDTKNWLQSRFCSAYNNQEIMGTKPTATRNHTRHTPYLQKQGFSANQERKKLLSALRYQTLEQSWFWHPAYQPSSRHCSHWALWVLDHWHWYHEAPREQYRIPLRRPCTPRSAHCHSSWWWWRI